MSATTKPYINGMPPAYRKLLVSHVKPSRLIDSWHIWQQEGSFEPIIETDAAALQRVRDIVSRRLIARVEFVRDDKNWRRGAVAFDSRGELVVHIPNCLLGYSGSGTIFSRQVMEVLGMTSDDFDRMSRCVWHQHRYAVVASRQERERINGIDRTPPRNHVNQRWTWWRVPMM